MHFQWIFIILLGGGTLFSQTLPPPARPLEELSGDARSKRMVEQVDGLATSRIATSSQTRLQYWHRDLSSPAKYEASLAENRKRLGRILGVSELDEALPMTGLEYLSSTTNDLRLAEAASYVVHAVRWPVLAGVTGEGLYLKQRQNPKACVILLPDADQTPEQLAGLVQGQEDLGQAAHELALAGCDVIIPTLINRRSDFSGNPALGIKTNQSHREWLYRQTFELGRNVAGYELRKIFSLVEWMQGRKLPVGVAGYGEGGRLALFAAALDTRIEATLVSGAFDDLQSTWEGPLDRNAFGLLKEFGGAEIASMVFPRSLIIAHGRHPMLPEPVELPSGMRKNAAPAKLTAPEVEAVRHEIKRAREFGGVKLSERLRLVVAEEDDATLFPVEAVGWLRKELRLAKLEAPSPLQIKRGSLPDDAARQQRQVREIEEHARKALQLCERQRSEVFWKKLPAPDKASPAGAGSAARETFWNDVIGRLPDPVKNPNSRSRLLAENEAFATYEVELDVWDGVTAWGYLLIPKGLSEVERRPVVVCQHGLEGLPEDVINEDPKSKAYGPYKGFAATLARKGYITFAPHNIYRGKDQFRVLQRKLNLTGLSLFSVITGQHQQILAWLKQLPFVDPEKIAFYGLSYGGKTAMRVPALLPDYCLSICSGDFNEWVRKCATIDLPLSYVFTGEYEIWEWNMGNTFNYAEMAALIAPRPFMVERGHNDGVGLDEWVAYEFAKVFRFYNKQGLGDRAVIEYFDGPHTIHGVGTFEFLAKHLQWPQR